MVWFGKKTPRVLPLAKTVIPPFGADDESALVEPRGEGALPDGSAQVRQPIVHVEPVVLGQTVIGMDSEFKGAITSKGICRVIGRMHGDITATELILDIGSVMNGNIKSPTVQVQGTLIGNIAAENVSLSADAHVTGDIFYGSISMERGAHVIGNLKPQDRA